MIGFHTDDNGKQMFVICYEPQYDDDMSDKEEEVDFSVLKQIEKKSL